MVRRTRIEMEETRVKLIVMARQFFSEKGYVDTSMDDLTAQAGLTRGALYHHFNDKKGLLAAVVKQIDTEMDQRLNLISEQAIDPWMGFCERCNVYLEMALDSEYQRIVLRDARAILGGTSPDAQQHCIRSMQKIIEQLIEQQLIEQADAQALAALIYGSLAEAAFWIADGDHDIQRLAQARTALNLLLRGLLVKGCQ